MNSHLGYLLAFDIYQEFCSNTQQQYEAQFGKGEGTLLSLLESLPEHIKQLPLRIYFGNYFTGLPLIAHQSSLNYGATETLRENRIPKDCPIKNTKAMKKA